MTEDIADYAADIDDDLRVGPSQDQVKRLVELAKLQLKRERALAVAEADFKRATRELAEVAERDLPNLLTEMGLAEYPLLDRYGQPGPRVVLKSKIVASILAENRPTAFEWFHKHGFGPLVKRKVVAEFGRGDAKKAGKLLGYLHRWYKDFRISDDESIHASTLNAWAREFQEQQQRAMADGDRLVELPEVIKVTELRTTTVVLPKGVTEL